MAPSNPEFYTPTGLNWDAIRANWLKNASPEELEADERLRRIPNSELVKKPATPQNQRSYPNALSAEKIEQIVNYYKVGNKVSWIAEETGVSDATIRKYLVDAEVYQPGRDRARKKT